MYIIVIRSILIFSFIKREDDKLKQFIIPLLVNYKVSSFLYPNIQVNTNAVPNAIAFVRI